MDNDYEYEDFDENLDDFESDVDINSKDEEVELTGSLDGEFDAEYDVPLYGGYGSSINLDNLTEEQKDLYDDAYHVGM